MDWGQFLAALGVLVTITVAANALIYKIQQVGSVALKLRVTVLETQLNDTKGELHETKEELVKAEQRHQNCEDNFERQAKRTDMLADLLSKTRAKLNDALQELVTLRKNMEQQRPRSQNP